MESRSLTPVILKLGCRWRWMFSFTPRPRCHHGNNP